MVGLFPRSTNILRGKEPATAFREAAGSRSGSRPSRAMNPCSIPDIERDRQPSQRNAVAGQDHTLPIPRRYRQLRREGGWKPHCARSLGARRGWGSGVQAIYEIGSESLPSFPNRFHMRSANSNSSDPETGIDGSGPEGGLGFGIRVVNYLCKYGIKIHNCRDD